MSHSWTKAIAAYFDAAAPAYARAIDPVFSALAAGLVEEGQIQPHERVLDLGTGTGLAAEAAAKTGAQVTAIDFSASMLEVASKRIAGMLIQGDLHSLPIAANTFDAALASFAYNSTDPKAALTETHRLLKSGGRLLLQEWNSPDDISELVSDLFAEYLVDDPPDSLAQLREQMEQPIPWDELESVGELEDVLAEAGFTRIEIRYVSPQIELPDAETFLRYKLAWPIRAAELAAMSGEIRSICLNDLRENLAPFVNRQTGQFTWTPNIVRISAQA